MGGFFLPSVRENQRVRRYWSTTAAGISAPLNDADFSDVTLLLNMGGADASTTFTDLSSSPHTMTAHGNVQVDDSLGYNTALFDGSGDSISTPYVQADFDWWTEDYTIEAWLYSAAFTNWSYLDGGAHPAMIGCASASSATNYWSFGPISDGRVTFYYYNGSPQYVTSASSIATSSLKHISMSKSSVGIYLGLNGTVASPVAVSGTPQSSTSGVVLTIGQINNKSISGYVKAIRITKGAARYTSNFTPTAAPWPTS